MHADSELADLRPLGGGGGGGCGEETPPALGDGADHAGSDGLDEVQRPALVLQDVDLHQIHGQEPPAS
eukprot:753409-Hanusia_phi.AAC.2